MMALLKDPSSPSSALEKGAVSAAQRQNIHVETSNASTDSPTDSLSSMQTSLDLAKELYSYPSLSFFRLFLAHFG
jgi:hypothetical protein